jgi:hypothetical protein
VFVLLSLSLAACGGDDEETKADPACNVQTQTGCENGQVCETGPDNKSACYAPVSIQGRVYDVSDDSAIEGARVVARDANDVAISGVAVSGPNGRYTLRVPAKRDADGKPQKTDYTLRADAAGFLTFPKAPRIALPVDVSSATGDPLTAANAATDIGLVPLSNANGLGSISGKVLAEHPAGTLLVAGGVTATADTNGEYTVFNLPAGSHQVRGYLSGVNLQDKTADVKADENTAGVDLAVLGDATATVSGNVSIVNAPGGSKTSVILAVKDTFIANAARGESPPGLRAADVTGSFRIEGVPDGTYVVLAAFENDGLVRDPDVNIGGTAIVEVTVAGDSVALAQNFKVTAALEVFSPTDGQNVSSVPVFSFEDDSSEETYTVWLFDVLGNEVWKKEGVAGPKGSKPVDVAYDGDLGLIQAGSFYQFRAVSIKAGSAISATEDLKGVFFFQ